MIKAPRNAPGTLPMPPRMAAANSGSVPGAFLGALIIGLGEAATVQLAGAQWRAAVAFVVLIAVLMVRPAGLFGRSS